MKKFYLRKRLCEQFRTSLNWTNLFEGQSLLPTIAKLRKRGEARCHPGSSVPCHEPGDRSIFRIKEQETRFCERSEQFRLYAHLSELCSDPPKPSKPKVKLKVVLAGFMSRCNPKVKVQHSQRERSLAAARKFKKRVSRTSYVVLTCVNRCSVR